MKTEREPVLRMYVDGDDLRIVQITDLHLAYRYILKDFHLARLRRMLHAARPDIVVNTGDLFCSRKRNSPMPLMKCYMKYIGAEWPWAFSWGNHDLEMRADYRSAVDDFLDSCPRTLYTKSHDFFCDRSGQTGMDGDDPDGFLGGNYAIEIFSRKNGRTKPSWRVFVFNSGCDDHVSPVVLEWSRELCARYEYSVPSICFMHRPTGAMAECAARGDIHGVSYESVGCAPDTGELHVMLSAMRTVKCCFVGHDHSNNFHCTVDGITYVASRKSLSLSYGMESCENTVRGKNRGRPHLRWGVTLINLSMSSSVAEIGTMLETGPGPVSFRAL
jgi:Predicted phosphohydrolases